MRLLPSFLHQGGQVHSITSASKRDEPGTRRERLWRASISQSPEWRLPLHPSILLVPKTPSALCSWAPARCHPLGEKQPSVRSCRCLRPSPPTGKRQPESRLRPSQPLHACLTWRPIIQFNFRFNCPVPSQPARSTRTHSSSFPLTPALTVRR